MPASRGERGAATAEFAMILPALVLLVAFIAGAGTIGLTQLRAHDAARAAAREAARGEPQADVLREARERAGSGAGVSVRTEGGYTVVAVDVELPESLHLIRTSVRASATARTEGIR